MVEIIYENPDWLPFFHDALDEIGVPHRLNFIEELELDVTQPPDDIIYLNRVSPSSDTRGHHRAIIRGEQYLEHLAAFNRVVINDRRTFQFEHSKVDQYRLMKRYGLNYPRTVFGSDIDQLLDSSAALSFPVLTKHNRSGKGLGVRKFDAYRELTEYLHSHEYSPSPDGTLLLQEYIRPKNDRIIRIELIDGRLVYAFSASTNLGFALCPADACQIDNSGRSSAPDSTDGLFEYLPSFSHQLVGKYEELAKREGFDIVGIEFLEAQNGITYTYDINATSNYSPDVEAESGHKAKSAFQKMIRSRLL